MAAYVIGAHALEPAIPIADVAAASAVVMLAASLPISLAGWGVREVKRGPCSRRHRECPAEEAFVVAAAVGIVSDGGRRPSVGVHGLVMAGQRERPVRRRRVSATTNIDYGALPVVDPADRCGYRRLLPGLCPNRTRRAHQHQLRRSGGGYRRLLFVVWAIRDRQWPAWRLPGFNAHVLAATAAIAVAFLIGWASFGLTDWSSTNRLLGWFVLLGYGATGALIATRAGIAGYGDLASYAGLERSGRSRVPTSRSWS